MRKILLLVLIFCAGLQFTYAQNIQVGGTVTSAQDASPIPGASIKIKGTSTGVITNADGKFTISVADKNAVLEISFVGMKTKEVTIGEQTMLNITLEPKVIGLDEVVVIGYQVENRRDITGSIASVTSDLIEKMPAQSIDKLMQGRAAGVQVTSNSGLPGSAVTVRVRGTGSINASNSPLYIIDGIQVNTSDDSRILNSSNPLSALNPNDIESIDILKDAASASIYGAQAANGVVIITTKKGKEGRTKFEFSASRGVNNLIKELDMLNGPEWMELSLEAYENYAYIYGRGSSSYVGRYTDLIEDYEEYGLIVNPDGTFDYSNVPSYNWANDVFRTGIVEDYQLTASGGNDKTHFFVSGSYNNTQGQVIETDFERFTFRSNLGHKINKKLWFNSNISLSTWKQNNTASATAYANPYRTSMLMVPLNPIYNEDGSYNTNDFIGNYDHNVVMEAIYDIRYGRTNKVLSNFDLNYEIFKDLVFKSSYSVDYQEISERKFYDPRTKSGAAYNGRVTNANTRRENLQTEQVLTYNKTFGLHKINALAGFSFRHEIYKSDYMAGNGVPSQYFQYVSSTAVPDGVSATESDWKMAGLFSRLGYIYNDKYIVNLTLRRDGSSRFGENSKWGVFPAASVAWRLSSESFMQGLTFIDDMKLKASYGITGNTKGIGYYSWRRLYSAGGVYNGNPAAYPSTIGNADLTWEQNNSFNAGIDYSLFKGRVRGGIDVYHAIRDNLLYSRPLPRTTGYSSRTENVGKVENRGVEFYLHTVNVRTKDFQWSTSFNIAYNENKVLELIDGSDQIGNTLKVGEPINTYRTQVWAGVNPADGRPMFYDKDGNITYNPKDEDRQWVGSLDPKVIGGLNTDLSYKGFNLGVFFQFQTGGRAYSGDFYRGARSGSTYDRNQYQSQYDDRWQEPGDITWVAMPIRKNYYYRYNPKIKPYTSSSRNYLYTDYIRLKNISLSYDLPQRYAAKIKLNGVQVYAQATNLWTMTNFLGWDPEFAGSDSGVYPQSKNVTMGVKLSF